MLPTCLHLSLPSRGFWLVPLLLSVTVFSGPTNRTIDDTYGDSVTGALPTYSDSWNVGQNCPGCRVQPSASSTFMGSWHDTTSDNPNTTIHSVTLSFQGTAIWVNCILVNSGEEYITIYSNLSFELDGATAGSFIHTPQANSPQYLYNSTVYGVTGLSNKDHTLVMTAEQGSQASLLLFDWAQYTFDDDTASPTTTSSGQPTTIASPGSAGLVTSDAPAAVTPGPSSNLGTGPSVHASGSQSGRSTSAPEAHTDSSQPTKPAESTGSLVNSSTPASGSPSTAVSITDSTHHGMHLGAIVGGAVGGIAFVVLCGALVIHLRRRARSSQSTETAESGAIEPPASSPTTDHMDAAAAFRDHKHASAISATPTTDRAVPALDTTDSSSLVVHANSVDPSVAFEKEVDSQEASSSGDTNPTREAQRLRERVATLRRAKLSIGDIALHSQSARRPDIPRAQRPDSAIAQRVDTPSTMLVKIPPAASARSADEENEELKREMACLRAEMARLQAETEALIAPVDSEPPPAYS